MNTWTKQELSKLNRVSQPAGRAMQIGSMASPRQDRVSLEGLYRRMLACCLFLVILVVPSAPALAQGEPLNPAVLDPFYLERQSMINDQVRRRGIDEPQVLEAMETVPRHLFVDRTDRPKAYSDSPVSIAPGQTMSQAYVSARMIALLGLKGEEKVLEVGTGSGYDAALLSRLAKEVFTIEIDKDLGSKARRVLGDLGYRNVKVKIADGYRGWPEEAPFDAILVTTAPEYIPQPLVDQLKVGGHMVIAVGKLLQDLQVVTKTAADEYMVRKVSLVNLAPMQGEIRQEN